MKITTRNEKPPQKAEVDQLLEYEKRIYDLKQLLEISKSLNSTLDYNILIDSILYICMAQMKIIKAALFVKKALDSTTFSLHRNHKGFDLDHSSEYTVEENHPVIQLFSKKYGCYTLEEIEQALGNLHGLDGLACLEPSLIIPLKAKGIINGIIILGDRIDDSPYDNYERDLMVDIAILASIAISNAFLFEMTTTDMMTKLKMKHYFYSVLLEKLEKINEFPSPLSIIMMDIDFFKNVNDSYGHSCGDAVLKQVAKIISENVRVIDIAARYGGEEFVLLLGDSDKSKALVAAERIRQAIEATETVYEGISLKITISCGVACYNPDIDFSAKALIDRADRALYRSKQEGRNRVSVAD